MATLKTITYSIADDLVVAEDVYEGESDVTLLVFDFTDCEVDTWVKWFDVRLVGGSSSFINLGTGLICNYTLPIELMTRGRLEIQPYAIDPLGVTIKFGIKQIIVNRSISAVNDGIAPSESVVELLLSAISELETSKAEEVHTHVEEDITDLDKYTQEEINSLLFDKADAIYVDENFTTLSETQQLREQKADTLHDHSESQIYDLDKYSQAEIDLLLEPLTTPRWTDLTFPFTQTKQGANLKPDFDFTNIGLLFPRNDTTEAIYIIAQMPHSYLEGSDIKPHIHCLQKANQGVVFTMEYKWYNIGDLEPAGWSTYTLDAYEKTYVSGSLSQVIKGGSFIEGTGKKISSILKIKLYRQDNTYTGDFFADQFDIHYQVDSFGSTLEGTK